MDIGISMSNRVLCRRSCPLMDPPWLHCRNFGSDETWQKLERDIPLPQILNRAPLVRFQKFGQRHSEIFVVKEDFPHIALFIQVCFEDNSRESMLRSALVMNRVEDVETI